ncbi:MAG: LysR family transcriptional regulator [Polyangiaceae bacterium]
MMLPDTESLRCFVVAAHHQSFRRAAREVALSPAAFSDRMKRLEEVVGERLFVRTTRSCRLSKAGERALPFAKAALEAAQRCVEAGSETKPSFDLVLGTRFELGLSWLLPALGPLEETHPERQLHLYFGDTDALLSALTGGQVDAIVTSARLSHANLETASLHEEHYALVAAPSLLGAKPLAGFKDASEHVLLDVHLDLPLFRYFLDRRPPRETWRFAGVRRLGTIAAILTEARRGAGIAVLPRYFVEPSLASGELVEPLPKSKLSVDFFRLVWRKGHPRTDDLAELAGELRELPLQ